MTENQWQANSLYSSLRAQLDTGRARFHMPGHKGILPPPFESIAPYDMTELPGTDSLYEATGCLLALEKRFSRLYDTELSVLSASGSTLCIQTMLALLPPGSTVLCERGLHISALNAMGLLGLTPAWVLPCGDSGGSLPCPPAAADFAAAYRRSPHASAVYVTSPNYYGALADIRAIAEWCHSEGLALLCDNAHGAHLRFLSPICHPIALGADICCDSLHKTLPALTGAALLHVKKGGLLTGRDYKRRMSWFGSTSPSYLIMLSADLLAKRLATTLPGQLQACARRVAALKSEAEKLGAALFLPLQAEPLRLTLPIFGSISQQSAYELLKSCQIEPEICSPMAVVLLFSPENTEEEYERALRLLRLWPKGAPLKTSAPCFSLPKRAMPLREAMLAQSERIPLNRALSRVVSGVVAPCPPGVPLLMSGEMLDRDGIFLLESYGINEIDVVK